MAKTKIVVIQMKELIYTAIFARPWYTSHRFAYYYVSSGQIKQRKDQFHKADLYARCLYFTD